MGKTVADREDPMEKPCFRPQKKFCEQALIPLSLWISEDQVPSRPLTLQPSFIYK